MVSSQDAPTEAESPVSSYFKKMEALPSSVWLSSAAGASRASYGHETMAYFSKINSSTKEWLADYQEKKVRGIDFRLGLLIVLDMILIKILNGKKYTIVL